MDIRDVSRGGLSYLDETLWQWINIHENYTRSCDWEDSLWWYNERASLSVFAGAIWRTGGTCLEEFSADKEGKDENGRVVKKGRCDLYFKLGKRHIMSEAKPLWQNLRTKNPISALNEQIKSAENDAKNLKTDVENRMAIVLSSLKLPCSYEDSCTELVSTWVKEIRKMDCAIKRAWIFPEKAQQLRTEKYIYPGTAIFISEI